jgi:hypothetical protein
MHSCSRNATDLLLYSLQIVPADLNAFLYQLERNIAWAANLTGNASTSEAFNEAAALRRAAMQALLWNNETGEQPLESVKLARLIAVILHQLYYMLRACHQCYQYCINERGVHRKQQHSCSGTVHRRLSHMPMRQVGLAAHVCALIKNPGIMQ